VSDRTTDPGARSWIPVDDASDFPIQNLPYGAFLRDGEPRLGVAIGEHILDLRALAENGLLDGACDPVLLTRPSLNPFLASGRAAWRAVRERLFDLLREGGDVGLRARDASAFFVARASATMDVPMQVGDYVDFYSSIEHATNLGKIFRPDGEALMPNWRWMPIGYHGRSGTIVIDGTPVRRPNGQRKAPDAAEPSFGPTRMLDIEVEVGFVTGPANAPGSPIPAGDAREHVFGLCIVNDWSARDIQAWEYVPLGPFLGKSFATTVSPWIVTLDALEPFRVAGPAQEPPPLDYLRVPGDWNYEVALDVELTTAAGASKRISQTNYRFMYWNIAQQLAHATVNGAVARPGDLFASGTISGPTRESLGSLIELTWRGRDPIELPDGEQRTFLDDGDTVAIHGRCEAQGARAIGFGSARGTIAG
jgi:fumarylacetoacetase